MRCTAALVLFAILSLAPAASPVIIRVPGDQPTIREGLSTASAGMPKGSAGSWYASRWRRDGHRPGRAAFDYCIFTCGDCTPLLENNL